MKGSILSLLLFAACLAFGIMGMFADWHLVIWLGGYLTGLVTWYVAKATVNKEIDKHVGNT